MKFQVLLELREAHKTLDRRLPHLPDIFETKMIRDQRFDLLRVVIRESKFATDPLSHASAEFNMSIEADPCARPLGWRKGRRLAYVVKQHAPSESGRAIWRKPLQHHSRVNPNISLWLKLRRLLHALHARDLGEHHGK